jgi:hypothetical protein
LPLETARNLASAADPQFAEDVVEVELHTMFAEAESFGDLMVSKTLGGTEGDLPLPRGE